MVDEHSDRPHSTDNLGLAAAWDAGFDAASLAILTAYADAMSRGVRAARVSLQPVPNPYRGETGRG